MSSTNIFLSVGGTSNDKQEQFVQAIEQRLRSENLEPKTVGRNSFSSDAPLKAVLNLMDDSAGAIIIALERSYFSSGMEKRGGPNEKTIGEKKIPTPWNHIEASMAYAKGKPLFAIIEEGLAEEGLLETGYDWHVMHVTLTPESLHTPEFNGVLADWKSKLLASGSETEEAPKEEQFDPTKLTVGQILKNMKPATLWGVLVFLFGLIAGAFILGQKFHTLFSS